jgi:hypoxanthine phosphoribosyltransferase
LKYITNHLLSFRPKTIKICALIDKLARRAEEFRIYYIGKTVEKGFLVGYGLEYAEGYRKFAGNLSSQIMTGRELL